jgi:putative CocE/NonD family hydrolase
MSDPTQTKSKVCFDDIGEILRFFDHHLKGIQNGIESEPPIHYYTMGEGRWKTAETWPPLGFQPQAYYFGPDAALLENAPSEENGRDEYQVDFSATTGAASRWVSLVNISGKKIEYPDRRQADEKLLVYQTAPLAGTLELTGHPVLCLYVRSSDPDPLFFAYLEDVAPDGRVIYITEGQFRGMHRKLSTPEETEMLPIPTHSYRRQDALPLDPDEVAEIRFDLQPVSYRFQVGHAIRIALAGADADNFEIIPDTPPRWEVFRSSAHPSHLTLPVKEVR